MEAQAYFEGRMPPKLDKNNPSERLQVVVPIPLIKIFDEWRGKQWPIPTRSEAIRIAMEEFVERRQKKGGKSDG